MDVTPRLLEYFQIRKDVDRIDLLIDGKLIDASTLSVETDTETPKVTKRKFLTLLNLPLQ